MKKFWLFFIVLALILLLRAVWRYVPQKVSEGASIRGSIGQTDKEQEAYQAMRPEQLSDLPDLELMDAVRYRLNARVEMCPDKEAGVDSLPEPAKAVYCVLFFDDEIQNGGLCQFFVNFNKSAILQTGKYLSVVGADEYRTLFDGFIQKHGIDSEVLSGFRAESVTGYLELMKKYPFEDFDAAYMEICGEKSITEYLASYIRSNIEGF